MLERVLLVAAILAAASLIYWWWNRRQGRVRTVTVPGALTPEELGGTLGMRGTFVQFTTPVCAKCPPTKRLLLSVAAETQHIAHIEVDASERLDLARELNIMRTPTTLVLDARGVVVARMDGAMTVDQARESLASLPPAQDYRI